MKNLLYNTILNRLKIIRGRETCSIMDAFQCDQFKNKYWIFQCSSVAEGSIGYRNDTEKVK